MARPRSRKSAISSSSAAVQRRTAATCPAVSWLVKGGDPDEFAGIADRVAVFELREV